MATFGVSRFPLALLLAASGSASEAQRMSPAKPDPGSSGIPVARLSFANKVVEQAGGKAAWKRAEEGTAIRTGDRLRTAPDALARMEFGWTSVTVGPSSLLAIPPSLVLSTLLEQGRVELRAEGAEIVKLRTAEAEVRGKGRVVVRREGGATRVMAMKGAFRIEAAGKSLSLAEGEGAVVRPGRLPSRPVKLAPPPAGLSPGTDPRYVGAGKPILLTWKAAAPAYHIEVLPIDSEDPLVGGDVDAPPFTLEIPWLGTYRWRVSVRDEQGLEGMPSPHGFICVFEK